MMNREFMEFLKVCRIPRKLQILYSSLFSILTLNLTELFSNWNTDFVFNISKPTEFLQAIATANITQVQAHTRITSMDHQ